jgi:hypothetical protein
MTSSSLSTLGLWEEAQGVWEVCLLGLGNPASKIERPTTLKSVLE